MAEITQEELKKLLHYDPNTGVFVWKVSRGRGVVGSVAGYLNKGYIRIKINKKQQSAHRLAWLYVHGHFPYNHIDHINGVSSDNRLCNLRDVSHRTNLQNQKLKSDNSSGFTGVYFREKLNSWGGQIAGLDGRKYKQGDLLTVVAWRMRMEKELGYHENHGKR